jgi:hypothetical protein
LTGQSARSLRYRNSPNGLPGGGRGGGFVAACSRMMKGMGAMACLGVCCSLDRRDWTGRESRFGNNLDKSYRVCAWYTQYIHRRTYGTVPRTHRSTHIVVSVFGTRSIHVFIHMIQFLLVLVISFPRAYAWCASPSLFSTLACSHPPHY